MAAKPSRFVSRLTQNTMALVLAGGRGTRLGVLTDWRTKPAVPFGGKFRIIDFTLSNCLNSRIRKICVLTQYKSHSLIQHLRKGWSFLNNDFGEFVDIIPAQQWVDDDTWYRGTADAVYQTMDIIDGYGPENVEYVLILAGDHIYTMDYGEMLAEHADSGADLTIACHAVPKAEAPSFGVMEVDETNRVFGFEEKPEQPKTVPGDPDHSLVSMGIYVFSRTFLRDRLELDAANEQSDHDFGKNVIPMALREGEHVQAYRFLSPARELPPYWRDVGTVDAYYRSNMEILSTNPPLDLFDPNWQIMTHQAQLPPAHIVGGGCAIENTMVSGGCVIHCSKLHDTLLYSNVRVGERCELDGVLALPGVEIGANCRLTKVILDNQCRVPDGTIIGEDHEADRRRFAVTDEGVVVVNREMLGHGPRYMPGISICTPRSGTMG